MPMTPRANSSPADNHRRQPETRPLSALRPVQPSFTPAPLSRLTPTKRKRSQDSEAEADEPQGVHPSKQPRKLSLHEGSGETLQEDSIVEADKSIGVRHSEEPQELSPHPPPVQTFPTSPAPIAQPVGTKRKRLQDTEAEAEAEADELKDVRPSKQPRKLPSSELPEEILTKDSEAEAKTDEQEGVHPSEHPQGLCPLTEENLHALYKEVMGSTANNARPGSIKRSSSRRSTTAGSDITQETTRTKGSSSSNAHYRFEVLAPAQINIHADPPPKNIQDAIDAIVYGNPPRGRREQLELIAREFQARCIERTRASVGENDFVKILHDALDAMRFDILCFRTNADWNDQLKPKIQHSPYNVGLLRSKGGRKQQKIDDPLTPPPAKRQQQAVSQPYISPQPSIANGSDPPPANGPQESVAVLPLAPPHVPEKEGTIKTPRPDITMGLLLSALASALSSQGLNEVDALLFLKDLQRVMESREPDGTEEPMLISVPAPRASDLVFPFSVDEGKAYLTGKQISEAENQAAGSGACAIKMQLRLDELVKRNTAEPAKDQPPISPNGLPARSEDQPPKLPPPSENQIPLFFPICTEGPLHVLWVQWTEVKHGKRQYNMRPLKCVYGVLPDGLVDFFVMVDNVLRWGTGHFLESLVVRLGKVARNTETEALVLSDIKQ